MTSRAAITSLSKALAPGQAAADARAALERDDFDAAATALLAGALKGEPIEPAGLGRLLRGVDDPILICALLGKVGAAAVDPVCEALDPSPLTTAQEAHLLFAAVELLEGAPPPPRLLAHLRLKARVQPHKEDAPILDAALTTALGEAAPRALSPDPKVRARVAEARAWLKGPLEKILPEDALLGPPLPGTRKVDKVPRNAPCPCGSGKKYKVCHGGADADAGPAAASLDARLKSASPELLPKHVDAMRLTELLRLDFPAMTTLALSVAYDRLCALARLDVAERALEELVTRKDLGQATADDYRADFILFALEQGRPEYAQRQRARLASADRWDELHQLELDWLSGDLPVSRVEAVAKKALASPQEPLVRELAWVLSRRSPALGVLAARAGLAAAPRRDAQELLLAAEEMRDRLLLPAREPAWALYEALFPASRDEGADGEKERAALDARARELEKQLTESQKRLTEVEGRLHVISGGPPAAGETEGDKAKLQQKVNELKELLKEGNRERSELRRTLQQVSEQKAEAAPSGPPPPALSEPPEEGDGLEAPRGVLLPTFSRAAADALERLPKNVARDAVLKVSEVSAGLPNAWREVKRMLHVPGYYSVRVGIHHRVLFHLDGQALQVDEVIHRQDLDATVRRLGR